MEPNNTQTPSAAVETPAVPAPTEGADQITAFMDNFTEESAPVATPPAESAEQPAATTPKTEVTPPAVGAETQPNPATQETPSEPASQPKQTDTQLAEAIGKLTETLTKPAPTKQEDAPKPQEEEPLPSYLYKINAQLMDGLVSENAQERERSLQLIISNLGQEIHRNLRKESREHTAKSLAEFAPNVVSQSVQHQELVASQKKVADDYYGAYPELNLPHIKPYTLFFGQQLLTGKYKGKGWTPELRDELATMVANTFNIQLKKNAPVVATQVQPKPVVAAPVPLTPRAVSAPAPAADVLPDWRDLVA